MLLPAERGGRQGQKRQQQEEAPAHSRAPQARGGGVSAGEAQAHLAVMNE